MSSDGRYVVLRKPESLVLMDTRGSEPARDIDLPLPARDGQDAGGLSDFAVVGETLWAVHDGLLRRLALADGAWLPGETRVDRAPGRLWPDRGAEEAPCALWLGARRMLLGPDGRECRERRIAALGGDGFVRLAGGRGLLVGQGPTLRLADFDGGDRIIWNLPATGRMVAAESLAGSGAFVVLVDAGDASTRAGDGSTLIVLHEDGAVRTAVSLPRVDLCAVAARAGVALLRTRANKELMAVDLDRGRILSHIAQPLELAGLCLDQDARFLAMAGFESAPSASTTHAGSPLGWPSGPQAGSPSSPQTGSVGEADATNAPLLAVHIPFHDLFRPAQRASHARRTRMSTAADALGNVADEHGADTRPTPPAYDGTGDIPPLHGLGRPYRAHHIPVPPEHAPAPYDSADEHIDDLLQIAVLRTARAIALAWHQGLLHPPPGAPAELPLTWERVLRRHTGISLLRDPAAIERLDQEVFERHVMHVGLRTVASLAQGRSLPFADLCYNQDLSYPAAQLLLMVAAPVLRADIAQLYGILANDDTRPVCDLAFIEQILGGEATLAPVLAPLVELGLVRTVTAIRDGRCYTPVVVEPIALAYMRGQRFAGTGPDQPTSIHQATHGLAALAVPAAVKRTVVALLAGPRPDGRPHRVVLRGPAGSGRRSLAAALAGELGKPLALIHCSRLVAPGRPVAEALRRALLDAMVRSTVPMLIELDALPGPREPVREVLRNHPGPLFVRGDAIDAGPAQMPDRVPDHVTDHVIDHVTDHVIDHVLGPDDQACFTLPAAAIPASPATADRATEADRTAEAAPARSSGTGTGTGHDADADAASAPDRPARLARGARHDAGRAQSSPPRLGCAWRTASRTRRR